MNQTGPKSVRKPQPIASNPLPKHKIPQLVQQEAHPPKLMRDKMVSEMNLALHSPPGKVRGASLDLLRQVFPRTPPLPNACILPARRRF
jgi:hypothetical protein